MPRTKPTQAQQVEIVIPPLWDWQLRVRAALQQYRFVPVSAARQIGKTELAVLLASEVAMQGGTVWWVAPNFKLTNPGYDKLRRMVEKEPFKSFVTEYKQRRHFTFRNGGSVGTIEIISADDPTQVVGATLDLAVIDEAARMHPDAWYEGVFSTLTVKRGKALLITNPRGKNWFWELWRRGDPNNPDRDPDYMSFEFSQRENPLVTTADIESQRKQLPPKKFQREVLGQFVDDGGEVFLGVRDAAQVEPGLPPYGVYNPDHEYVIGADISAGRQDFTVAVVLDVTAKAQAALYHWSESDMDVLIDKFATANRQWNAKLMMIEENASGLFLPTALRKAGVRVEAFNTNWKSKAPLIDAWSAAIEMKQVKLLRDDRLIKEHEAYESDVTENGIVRFSAPKGGHDDIVMASALAWHAMTVEQALQPQPLAFTPFQGLYGKEKPRTRRVYR